MRSLLFTNGIILPMDDSPQPGALCVQDGRIVGMGDRDDMRSLAGAEREEIDLQGGTLLPAFVDSHSHIAQYAATLRFANLSQARSYDEVAAALETFARENAIDKDAWLIGVSYDPDQMQEHAQPTKAVLDSLPWPVMISHASGHMGCLNSRGLQKAGLSDDTPDPSGGRYGRDAQGKLTGFMEENAFMALGAILQPPSMEEQLELLRRAQTEYLQYGVLTAQEGLLKQGEYDLLQAADERGLLTLDVRGYADMRENLRLKEKPEGRFRVAGYKIFLDGSPQGRTAWLTEPYLGGEECGYPIYDLKQVKAFVERAAAEHRQLLAHCNGDAAIQQFLDAHEQPSQTRNVVIHAQLTRRDQLPRMKALRLIPSFFVAHTWYYGDAHIRNLGWKRAAVISPLHSALEVGIAFTLHQDTPVLPPNMLETVWHATHRITREGQALAADEQITLLQALRAMTCNAAYQGFEETEKGTLAVGKRADLLIFRENLLQADDLRRVRPCAVVRQGERVL